MDVVGLQRKLDWDSMRVNFFVAYPPGVLEPSPPATSPASTWPPTGPDLTAGLVERFQPDGGGDVVAIVKQLQAVMGQLARGGPVHLSVYPRRRRRHPPRSLVAAFDERRYELSRAARWAPAAASCARPCSPNWPGRCALAGGLAATRGEPGRPGAGAPGVRPRFALQDRHLSLAMAVSAARQWQSAGSPSATSCESPPLIALPGRVRSGWRVIAGNRRAGAIGGSIPTRAWPGSQLAGGTTDAPVCSGRCDFRPQQDFPAQNSKSSSVWLAPSAVAVADRRCHRAQHVESKPPMRVVIVGEGGGDGEIEGGEVAVAGVAPLRRR